MGIVMKKSHAVSLGLLASSAGGILAGCGGPPPAPIQAPPPNTQIQQCVDAQGRVVPDEECEKTPPTGTTANQANGSGGFHGGMGMFPFWIYHMGSPMPMGTVVPNAGLRSTPMAGMNTLRGSAALRSGGGSSPGQTGVSRGGFGSSSTNSAVHS